MTGCVRFVYLLTLGIWLGAIVFFSFVVAPAAFQVLETARAGDLVAVIFPRYYAAGAALGTTAVAGALYLRRGAAVPRAWTAAILALALAVGVTAWAGAGVQPRARRLRMAMESPAADPAVREAFRRAHRTAVTLNGVALLLVLAGLGATARALRH